MGHYLALGHRSGSPGSCCNVIFCRSLVAGTEAYESAPFFSNLGVSVANESLWITCTVLQKYQSTKTCMKSNRDLTLHSQTSRVSQARILVPNLLFCPILLLQRTGSSTLCQSKFFHEFLYGFSSIHRCRIQA